MDFTTLQADLFAQGFDYLNDGGTGLARAKRYINYAYHELCDLAEWPFLQAVQTGPAPLVIADLGTVESVIDTTRKVKLVPTDRRDLTDGNPDLTVTGSPCEYFITLGTTINVWPLNTTDTLSVQYWKDPADLSAGGDTPILPARYHGLIVVGAAREALLENNDAGDYQLYDNEWQRGVARMTAKLLLSQHDRPAEQAMLADHLDA